MFSCNDCEVSFSLPKNGTEVPLSMAYCHDIENFVDQACKEKGINREEYDTIIETDDGKDVV